MNPRAEQRVRRATRALTPAWAALLIGCADGAGSSGSRLTARDFVRAEAPGVTLGPTEPTASPGARSGPPAIAPPSAPEPGVPVPAREPEPDAQGVFTLRPGPPGDLGPAPAPVESGTLVDAKVGDVNGRPIFAGEFLAPMAARLQAEAQRLPRDRWLDTARRLIETELTAQIEDELLYQEAQAGFSPEQKQGLRAWLDRVREDLRSGAYGSEVLAERRLRESAAADTIDDYLGRRERAGVIGSHLNQRVYDRVYVSWADMRNEYEKNADVFNPDPKAVLRLVRVRQDDAAGVEAVTQALARGVAFEEVARLEANQNDRDNGGRYEKTFQGDYAQATLFGPEALSRAARGLAPGGTAGPIEIDGSVYWLHLERIDRVSRPLSDPLVQLGLEGAIRRQQQAAERARYVRRLRERASFTDVSEMTSRLLQIAADRYFPLAPEPGGTPGS